ncbi:MAG TPA: DUF2721 domain-containing protein [Candidatus Elarobacter sp.]|jgi:hypothetical protein|nr:DUF2721 domain-containing protein [Candidatus Elarobacter sp.]
MNAQSPLALPSVLGVISAMITPAIFILATGSLVASTLTRISRTFDRARDLVDRTVAARASGDELAARTYVRWLRVYRRRTSLTERALTLYYVAIFLFVMASLSIALDDVTRVDVPWISLGLVLLGAGAICVATAFLVIETNLAAGMLRAEIGQALGEDWHALVDAGGSGEDARATTLTS